MSLAYERHGSGPPLVLLHGVGHRRQAWNAVLGLLAPHRTVIAVDLPGHGESPPLKAGGQPPVRVIAEEVIGFFGELGLDRPHVAGNSLGGALALLPALARTTAGRAVLDAAIVARPGKMSPEQAEGDALAFIGARDAVNAILADPPSFTADIPVGVPVTIAWGTRDRLLPPSQARVARQRLPGARFVALPGCGHVPMTDDPGLVARVLLDGSAHSAEASTEPRGGSPAA